MEDLVRRRVSGFHKLLSLEHVKKGEGKTIITPH